MDKYIRSLFLFFKKKEIVFAFLIFILISSIFFNKMFTKGYLPFPGDLLVGGYAPYNTYPFLGYAPGGYPNKAQDFDVLKLIYPAKYFSIEQFKNGEIPLWNSYSFSGNPHLSSLQSGSFYPLNIIFLIFPFALAWGFYIFLQPVLAGLFTYLLLREFRLTKKSSIFGGLVFAFSSYFVVWMEYGNIGHSILWLPFLFWLSYRNVKKPTINKSILMIIALTFSILAGYIQTSFYLFAFLFTFYIFNIFLSKENKKLNLLILISVFTLPIFLSLFQLLPMLELFNASSRTSYLPAVFIKELLIPSWHTITLIIPDFFGNPATRNYWVNGTYIERVSYIGILPLFFVLYILLKKRSAIILFFITSLIFAYLMSFDTFFSRIVYSLNIPFISTAIPTREMFVFCFSASVLAAFGIDAFEKSKGKDKSFNISLALMGLIFIFTWLFVFQGNNLFKNESWINNVSISKRNLILPTAFFGLNVFLLLIFRKFSQFKKYIIIAFFVLTIFDLYYFFQKITPFSPIESFYPKTEVFTFLKSIQGIDRSWGYGSGFIEPNVQTVENIYSTDGYDALHIKRYGEFISASKDGKIPEKIPRSEGNLAQGYGKEDLKKNIYRQRAINLLGVKYLLHKNDSDDKSPDYATFDESIYRLIMTNGMWQIYENKLALPRIFLSGNYIVEKDNNIIEKIYDPKFDLKNKLILEEKLPESFHIKEDKNAKLTIVKYSPNEIILKTNAASDMILFLSDNYFPGWKASINGKDQKIYRADYSFRAVPVTKGDHKIVMWYYPESFDKGLKISMVTLIGLLFFFLYSKFRVLLSAK